MLSSAGAIRATTYDNQIRNWIVKDVVKGSLTFETEKASMAELGRRLLGKDSLPTFEAVRLDRETLFRVRGRCV